MGLMNSFRRGQQPQAKQQMDTAQVIRQLQQNMGNAIQQKGYNVPTNLYGNGQGVMDHLLKTGQITRQQYDQAFAAANKALQRK